MKTFTIESSAEGKPTGVKEDPDGQWCLYDDAERARRRLRDAIHEIMGEIRPLLPTRKAGGLGGGAIARVNEICLKALADERGMDAPHKVLKREGGTSG